MILLCGIETEPPLAMVRDELSRLGIPFVMFNQRRFASMAMAFGISNGVVSGQLRIGTQTFPLESFRGVYLRLMDDRFLPEIEREPPGSSSRVACRALHEALMHWCEVTPARIVNRPSAMTSNGSKPFQLQLVRDNGLLVPETLITNDPQAVVEFRERMGRIVYKSISGVRSIVRTFQDSDLRRLNYIRWCPTQFQEFIDGTNVRVHTVGDQTFATSIRSSATDYRYANLDGDGAELSAIELPRELASRCVGLAKGLGLAFAGIDLKVAADGRAYCFEVNPCPAFSYYEKEAGQPIADAVARYLAGEG